MTHRGAGYDGTEQQAEERIEQTGGDGNAKGVVDKGEEEVLTDVAHHSLAQTDRLNNSSEIAFDERDAGAFHGYVRSRPHRDPNVGRGKSGRVVDSVPGHCDHVMLS